jgi:putative membrane protein
MLRVTMLLGLIGLGVATGLILWSGYHQVLQALSVAGWGILWTILAHLISMILCVIGWQTLLKRRRPGKAFFLYVLWIRAAINNLMPVARIGGEVVSVRLLMRHGVRKTQAVACTVVETTLSVLAVFCFTVLGVAFFTLHVSDHQVIGRLVMGLLLSLPLLAGFVLVQRIGIFGLLTKIFSLLFGETWKAFLGNTAHLDRAVRTMYRRRGRALACFLWQFASWCSGTIEIWLALHFLGHTVPLSEAFMIEALIQGTSSAAFVVPGALGVQEAGFLLYGHLLGLTPDVAAALAVIRRCRDLLLYAPGLIVWQLQEGGALLKLNRRVKPSETP